LTTPLPEFFYPLAVTSQPVCGDPPVIAVLTASLFRRGAIYPFDTTNPIWNFLLPGRRTPQFDLCGVGFFFFSSSPVSPLVPAHRIFSRVSRPGPPRFFAKTPPPHFLLLPGILCLKIRLFSMDSLPGRGLPIFFRFPQSAALCRFLGFFFCFPSRSPFRF